MSKAQRSVLADFARHSKIPNERRRVVEGQHLMQATSDVFLGWQRVARRDGVDRDYYVRQLRDWKFSNEHDYAAVAAAVDSGRAQAQVGL